MFWYTFWLISFSIFLFFLFFFSFNFVRLYTYFYLIIMFYLSLFLLFFFNKSIFWYQSIFIFYRLFFFNISCIFALDSISISLIVLSSFLLMFCFLIYWFLRYRIHWYSFIIIFTLWLLINVFSSSDLFFFYIFFEGIVIPMFLLIGIWGSRSRKIYASYQFFIYTLVGSLFVLLCFFSIYFNKGSSLFDFFLNSFFFEDRQYILLLLMFFGFAIKVPIVPLHVWLPEAHVEAPTPGSVILAGILLKLGTYAIFKLFLESFNYLFVDLIFIFYIFAVIGFLYASLVAFTQIDIKKIIAYSSIAHMNFSLIGLFSQTILGLSGVFVLMLGHAITSGALFFSIGVLYDRYKTRIIFYYGGLSSYMPLFSVLFFIFTIGNFGLPGTVNFVGEFLILSSGFFISSVIIIVSAFASIFSLIYSLFLYNRLMFGSLKVTFLSFYSDVSRLEFVILFIFAFFLILFGFYPELLIDFSSLSIMKIYTFTI